MKLSIFILLVISLFMISCIQDGDEPYYVRWISSIDLNGENLNNVIEDDYDSFHPIPQHQKILLSKSSGGLWVINEDGTGFEKIVSGQLLGYPFVSYDGDQLVFSMFNLENTDIFIYGFDSGELNNISDTENVREVSPTISTDGLKVCFTKINPDTSNTLIMYDVLSQESEHLLTYPMDLTSSPTIINNCFRGDSYDVYFNLILISEKALHLYEYDISNDYVVFDDAISSNKLSCSANGDRLIFESNSIIYEFAYTSFELIEISNGHSPSISLDGQNIVFVRNGLIYLNHSNEITQLRKGSKPIVSNFSELIFFSWDRLLSDRRIFD